MVNDPELVTGIRVQDRCTLVLFCVTIYSHRSDCIGDGEFPVDKSRVGEPGEVPKNGVKPPQPLQRGIRERAGRIVNYF